LPFEILCLQRARQRQQTNKAMANGKEQPANGFGANDRFATWILLAESRWKKAPETI
jgi:hypothetical protein